MNDPTAYAQLLKGLGLAGDVGASQVNSRALQGRLNFAATVYALRGQCNCDACRYLRKGLEVMEAEARKDLDTDAGSDHPPAPESRALPGPPAT